ncbi:MAG: hypothetical protein KAK00_04150 [Nanoarchaeota archaeon]|nr:hypothetical protein [Nanoarchaeota archaeon]
MYIPKKYGQSKIDKCPFCNQQATTVNPQSIPVCSRHKNSIIKDIKCICGGYLDIKKGKYGAYFSCMNCGNMNMKKVLEINDIKDDKETDVKKEKISTKYNKTDKSEITIRSDDPRYFT